MVLDGITLEIDQERSYSLSVDPGAYSGDPSGEIAELAQRVATLEATALTDADFSVVSNETVDAMFS